MAVGYPQQIFNNKIVRISFPPAGGGLVYFTFWYQDGYQEKNPATNAPPPIGTKNQMPTQFGPDFDFSTSPIDLDNFNMLTNVPYNPVPDNLPPEEKARNVPIARPNITLPMLAHYAGWTPADIWDRQVSTPGAPIDVYVIDWAGYMSVIQTDWGPMEGGFSGEFASREEAKQSFYSGWAMVNPSADINKIDATLARVWWKGMLRVPQFPPTPENETDAMFAENGWSYHVEPGSPTMGYGRWGIEYWIMNLGVVRKYLLAEKNKKDPNFSFRVTLPRRRDAVWKFQAGTIPVGIQSRVDIDPVKGMPVFKSGVQIAEVEGTDPSGQGEIIVTIDFQKKDPITRKTIPPNTTLTNAIVPISGGVG